MRDTNDWFHTILLFLYEKPFDGGVYDIKKEIADKNKIGGFNGSNRAHIEKLSIVIATLAEKNYIKNVRDLQITLTIDGYTYMQLRNRDKRQDILYWVPIAISFTVALIACLNYLTNVEKESLKKQLQEQKQVIDTLQKQLLQKESVLHPRIMATDSLKRVLPLK